MKCEVLAPAGSREALEAAVRCGADAVYLGAGKFNARQGAVNFGCDSALADAVGYCHARGVKVYLTLNTLVSDDELGAAMDELRMACDAGVDAVIVQDPGLARLIPKAAPGMHMHASTQMSVHSVSALSVLKDMGFCRVVLARELSTSETAEICYAAKSLGIEVEVFVHGALCMCLSGQCYMSGIIGQRSGNRGMCAQPCRMEYADGSYPLSLKDLSLINNVAELEKIGVTSLKIEGRMKRPEYVAAAVSAFRCAADGQAVPDRLQQLLSSVFSRSGHTDGYYQGKLGAHMFGRRTDDAKGQSNATFGELHALYRTERQSVAVDITLALDESGSVMTVTDGEHTVSASGQAEAALNRPLDEERAKSMCAKLGGTPFYLDNFKFENSGTLTMPASAVNAMRREVCHRLIDARSGAAKEFCPMALPPRKERAGGSGRIYVRLDSVAQTPENLHLADRVYVPLGSQLPHHREVGVEIPRAMFGTEREVAQRLKTAVQQGARYALCHNLAAVKLAEDAGLKVHLGFGMNIFNSVAASAIKAEDVTLSFELTLKQAAQVGVGGIIAYGRLPMMLTRNCPMGGKNACNGCSKVLKDRKGITFPVMCRGGYSEILNTKPVMLSSQRDRIGQFDFLTLYFTDESAHRCAEVLSCYRRGEAPTGDFTRGLYYRGV